MLKLMLLAGAGGFIGTCCRFLTNRLYLTYFNSTLPWATFTVNILGCFILGLILGLLNRGGIGSQAANAFLIVGFCGGYTTFSTFSFETLTLGTSGQVLTSLLYIGASIILGLIAVWVGTVIAR